MIAIVDCGSSTRRSASLGDRVLHYKSATNTMKFSLRSTPASVRASLTAVLRVRTP